MRSLAFGLCILNLLACVSAFYPYHRGGSSGKASGSSIESAPDHAAGGSKDNVNGAVKSHERRGAATPTMKSKGTMVKARPQAKRDNQYKFVSASPPTQTNSAGIHNDGTDFSYFASVKFGSSGKVLYMLVDTGAANTWVMGSDCTNQVCADHNTFGPEDSQTLSVSQEPFDLKYGTGSVSGYVANDTIEVAGISVSLSFGLASSTSEDFADYPMDGILGLGYPGSKPMDFPTAMETIQEADVLPSNILGVNLQRSSDGSRDGQLSFGAPDTTKYEGDLSYTRIVDDASTWEIPVDDVKVGGKSCGLNGRTAIIDTGFCSQTKSQTSFMLLPPLDAEELHGKIPNAQHDGETYTVPCTSDTSIQLVFSGTSYSISPKDYVGDADEDDSATCASNIIGRKPFEANQWLVGDVFLKNVYSVFDYDSQSIGNGSNKRVGSRSRLTSSRIRFQEKGYLFGFYKSPASDFINCANCKGVYQIIYYQIRRLITQRYQRR
ncbi:MAG: hypothetical protein Q9174_000460 [Haloplaca sp. 1 TL-2023]